MIVNIAVLSRMASSDGLEFPFDTNSFLFLESPETFSALTECQENSSLLIPEKEHNEIVEFVPVSAAKNDIHPSSLEENSRIDHQETLSRTSSFNQSFHHEDDHSNYLIAARNLPNMPSCTLPNGPRESVYSGNFFLASTNKVMTTGLQSVGLQHKPVSQSYQQPLLSPTNPDFSREPYVSTMMGTNVQEMERSNGLTNLNPIYGLQDQCIHSPMFQEEQYDYDLLLEQLKHIHENDQMQQPESSNMPTPTYMSGNYSPFAHTSYQSDPFAINFQNSSSLQTTCRTRGRPRKNQIPMPLVPTTQTPLTSPRHYSTREKGKQAITAMPSLNPTLYNQYQRSYTNTMVQQSGVLRQRSCYDQLENECSSSKIRRIMLPFQENSVADSSRVSFWQDGNMRSSAANHHEERSIKNTMYDPLYAGVGLPIDPHLRFF
ncbi:uncharacterized protein LOC18992732 [Eutrema salsugineum]|uniref:uncharacterized protein LOC18992732 n=1 Tax=Eutrema salsugineum TaxID=72664 RepID=UPI000CED55B1|nr:uncharacterized protein LOC18992732 [Eutrema salsugineum]